LETAAFPFGENGEIVISETENVAQDTDNLVGIPRIDHDRAESGQPGIGGIVPP